MKLAYFFVILVLLASCGRKNKIPDSILKPAKMQVVVWDILKAKALAEEIAKKDSTTKIDIENNKLQSEVFAIHNISKNDFYKSYNFYTQHTELMLALLDSVIAYAAKKNYTTNTGGHPLKLSDTLKLFK